MPAPLETLEYLAASENRVQVLSKLSDGPATRRDLQTATDASRSTVARILGETQDRGWVEASGDDYRLTPLGEAIVSDFLTYLASVEGVHHLGDLVNHLPPPLRDVDFAALRDAEVIESKPDNPAAPFTRALDIFEAASTYRGLTHTSLPDHLNVLRERTLAGELEFEHIFERSFVDTIRADPERRERWEPLENRFLVYDDVVPINLHLVDGTVLVWLGRDRGDVVGLLESENPAVVDWAESLYADYRTDAEPLKLA